MKLIDTAPLQQVLDDFIRARDWSKYHSPKNLSMALSVEVAELVEIFQWKTEEESRNVMATEEREHVRQELADILIYLTELASALGVDLDAAVRDKLELNAIKYPVPSPGPD
ncbi:nucleotide pyrophosphohydrolase [Cupriavidus sp. AU9028]|uniref:nucleotide pyrophosphohydrolase n=1 Tax=Cupriavidus sp. AU9028 TaxID=2871157 RepID=UPI001C981B38|nr:nucleotide pyrophosphohydrolase [Cupriavidus sp. AU9028]MBY4897782.1 nucleotide pyrophosphohydrolase [Cupriavidus sp. AU9028]